MNSSKITKEYAPHLGLEPRTSRLEVLRSIQLSQQGIFKFEFHIGIIKLQYR